MEAQNEINNKATEAASRLMKMIHWKQMSLVVTQDDEPMDEDAANTIRSEIDNLEARLQVMRKLVFSS